VKWIMSILVSLWVGIATAQDYWLPTSDPNLVAFYTCDANNWLDLISGGAGTGSGGGWVLPAIISGVHSNAWRFRANAPNSLILYNNQLLNGQTAYSISMFMGGNVGVATGGDVIYCRSVNFSAQHSAMGFAEVVGSGVTNVYFRTTINGVSLAILYAPNLTQTTPFTSLVGTWKSGEKSVLYLWGQNYAEAVTAAGTLVQYPWGTNPSEFRMGSDYWLGTVASMDIDEILIFKRAVTQNEAEQLAWHRWKNDHAGVLGQMVTPQSKAVLGN